MARLKEHIFLTGFMGVGKTSTSRALSRMLGVKETDTDAMIVDCLLYTSPSPRDTR